MMDRSKENNRSARKPYERPRLRTIDLAAEETLAVGCKTGSPGGGSAFGAATCTLNNCSQAGS